MGTFERRMRYTPTLPSKRNRSVQWNGNPNQKRMKALLRERLNTKSGTPTLQDARLLCDKRMVYAVVGGRLDTEPAIRLPSRKDQPTKTGTLTLQDARLPCGKRMAYAAVGEGLDAEPAIRLPDWKGLNAEPAIRPSSQKGRNARSRRGTLPGERFRDAVRGYSSGR